MKKMIVAVAIAAWLPVVGQATEPHLVYPLQTQQINDEDDAKIYIQTRYPATDSLSHRYTKRSLLGRHYNFVQLNPEGEPCAGSIVVSVDNDGQLYRLFNNLTADPAACEVSTPLPPRPHQLLVPPSGEAAEASMQVFDPDPRTSTGQALEEGHSNVDNIYIPAEAYSLAQGIAVTLSGGKLYLANPRVVAVDIESMVELDLGPLQGLVSVESGSDFIFTRDQHEFRDVNAFYHLDHSLRYLEDLGFTGELALFDAPLKVDAQGQSANNSTYLDDVEILAMGVGGVPDSEDGDVVLHELGHAINGSLVPDWQGGDSAGIGEGFSDYWAGAYSYWVQRNRSEKFELDIFANWDGIAGAMKSQRSLNDSDARYSPEFDYRAHVSVLGTLSDQLWSTPLFQSLKQAVQHHGEAAFDELNRSILEGFAGMGDGVKMYDLARSTVDAAARLYPDKTYASILEQHFKYHRIIRDEVELVASSSVISANDNGSVSLPAMLVNTSGHLLDSFRAVLHSPELNWQHEMSVKPVAEGGAHLLMADIPLPDSLQCGAKVSLNASITTARDSAQQSRTSEQQLSFVYGQPVLKLGTQQVESVLADARLSPQGDKLLLGENLYALKVDTGAVAQDFAIYLSLEHRRLSDLNVVLRTPSGSSISLLNYQAIPVSEYEYLFTVDSLPALGDWLGQPMSGNWTLEITDRVEGEAGKLISWGIGPLKGYQCNNHSEENKEITPSVPGSSGGSINLLTLLAALMLAAVRSTRKYTQ
ncbi:hypothetical protein C9I98_15905 [Photobacterium sanctipauli]|uniref:P/Homo B domain-containing protein n=1 Tax=Photobacterium sanctipauli TaxID=1342794 RepID=A0A2T3NQJ6_9GAMM|nr:proprotein convertase P-domain-containing protein [Photobacterium sanctipauli]PSW18556.1 hypothetical protein C9I98_15905 [Photobacterium sanctipauli]